MKRLLYLIVILSILGFACNITTSTPTPIPPAAPTDTQPAQIPDTAVSPTATVGVQANTTCNELSFYEDPAVGNGSICETIPESPQGIETYPEYTKLTITGYPLSGTFFEPTISVLPVQRYTELLPEYAPGQITTLQTLIGGGAPGDKDLPFLPTLNAAQMFHARYGTVSFVNGGGIRYLTLLAQFYSPIDNHDLFYTYQGLTADGKYWISAILPVNDGILPADGTNPPGGQSWDQFIANYTSYITDLTNQMNSQSASEYTPSIDQLDALVASITVQP